MITELFLVVCLATGTPEPGVYYVEEFFTKEERNDFLIKNAEPDCQVYEARELKYRFSRTRMREEEIVGV